MSTDLHTLSGAYALDAVTPEEAEEFARHLEDCESCRQEVAELREVAARMGAAEATAVPPPALRARVLAAVDQTPQLPPRLSQLERARSRRWLRPVTGAVAAVVLLVGAVAGIASLRGDDGAEVPSASVSQVFSAPDARVATVRTSDGSPLTVAVSRDTGQMAVQTERLTTLTGGRVYQMWAIHNGRSTSVGLVEDTAAGKVMPIPASGTSVAITVEPEGGSQQPTNQPIIQLDPAEVLGT